MNEHGGPILDPSRLMAQRSRTAPEDIPFAELPTPCDVIDLRLLEDNLAYLKRTAEASGARILLAQKAYSLFATYPLIGRYLSGTTASGLYEARLAHEEMPGTEVHVFCPAYTSEELEELLGFANVLIFNSPRQWLIHRERCLAAKKRRPDSLSFGLRVNPEYSEVEEAIYNPAAEGSRLGMTERVLRSALTEHPDLLEGIEGLHFHALCEDSAEALQNTLKAFEAHFDDIIPHCRWVNFGGGHHITRADYNVKLLVDLVRDFKARRGTEVYLEPGEAIPLDCGWLVTEVMDVVDNGLDIAILDCSASCHMPDVLEMPYRPRVFKIHAPGRYERGGEAGEKAHTVRLAGPTCLAGDVIGDYSFEAPLAPGDRLAFCDMSLYAHVKRNSFNGMPLPDLYAYDGKSKPRCLRHFTYEDFKTRLGTL